MRLINGEKLFGLLNQRYENSDGEARMAYSRALEHLCYMPTIDPVKHEHWIGYETTAYTGRDDFGKPVYSPRRFYRCHGCRRGTAVKTNYCPACGARMDANE